MAISTISITMMIVSRGSISLPLSISVSMSISISITMMIVSRGSISFPLSISVSMAISTISITMMIITGGSLPLAISISMAISVRVAMMIITWLSIGFSNSSWFGFSLAIAIAMTITTISMMVISWLSYGSSEEGKGNSNQKIHLLVGLNSSETPLSYSSW